MKQPRYDTLTALLAGGNNASSGAGAHEVTLNLEIGTKVLIDGALNPLILSRDAHTVARSALSTKRELFEAKTRAASDLLFSSRDLLKRSLGKQYSPAWDGTGFNYSLKMPKTVEALQNTIGTLKAFLVANPALEREELMTAEMLGTALDDLTNARNAVKLQESVVGTLLTSRRQKEKALRLRLRWLIDELGRVIDPLDDRWTAFGLNKPGLQQVPDRPGKVSVVLQAGGAAVKWKKSPRARYYRLWMKVIGADEDAIPVGSSADLDFAIESVPAASQIELSLSAVNNGGESARSEVVVVITP